MKIFATTLLIASLLLMLGACRGREPKRMPDTIPDIHGYVAQIKKTSEKSEKSQAVILVKPLDGVEARHTAANIRVDNKTLIETRTGEKLKIEQLREGHEVEAWFEGNIMESMPVQGYVKAIRVTEN